MTTGQTGARRLRSIKQRDINLCAIRWLQDSRPRGPWTVCFTLGIRGSYAESRWAASLAALGVPPAGVAGLMATLVLRCLTELNELYKTRSTALRHRLDAQ